MNFNIRDLYGTVRDYAGDYVRKFANDVVNGLRTMFQITPPMQYKYAVKGEYSAITDDIQDTTPRLYNNGLLERILDPMSLTQARPRRKTRKKDKKQKIKIWGRKKRRK